MSAGFFWLLQGLFRCTTAKKKNVYSHFDQLNNKALRMIMMMMVVVVVVVVMIMMMMMMTKFS